MKKIAVILLFVIFISGCVQENNKINQNNQDLASYDHLMSLVNSDGWEDSSYISSDGNTLYFGYINIDLLKLPEIVEIGPNRDKSGICNSKDVAFPCGQYPRADTFYSKKINEKWSEPVPHPLTISWPIIGLHLANDNKAYFHMNKDDEMNDDLYYAEKMNGAWKSPVLIENVNSEYNEDDPYVTPSDDELFFWSDKPSIFDGNNIYYSKKVDGVWSVPVLLPEPINSDANDMQPFLSGNALYFSSDRDGILRIYVSSKRGESWSTPVKVLDTGNPHGEPTLTGDGKYLFYVEIFTNEDGTYNADMRYAEF